MKKKLGFMTDHRFIIGVQIDSGSTCTTLVYLVAKPGPVVSKKSTKRPLAGKIISILLLGIFSIIGSISLSSLVKQPTIK